MRNKRKAKKKINSETKKIKKNENEIEANQK